VTDCRVLKIEKAAMLNVLHREHAFSDLFVAYLVGRYNQTQADLVDQLSTRLRSVWPGLFCCWLVLEKKGDQRT
jgi:hypothetical protein